MRLLLKHKADPNALCNGHTPLTLTLFSGNNLALQTLLESGADVNLPLPNGYGSAVWLSVSIDVERRRKSLQSRVDMMNTLVRFGADLLSQYPVGQKKVHGTLLDAAYYIYSADTRIAHKPYHALSQEEREIYMGRQEFLAQLATLLREQAVQQRERLVFLNDPTGSGKFPFLPLCYIYLKHLFAPHRLIRRDFLEFPKNSARLEISQKVCSCFFHHFENFLMRLYGINR